MPTQHLAPHIRTLCGGATLALWLVGGTVAWAAKPADVKPTPPTADADASGPLADSAQDQAPPTAESAEVIVYQPARASKAKEPAYVDNRAEVGSAEWLAIKAAMEEDLRRLKEIHPTWTSLEQRMLDGLWITDATPLSPEDRAAFEAKRAFVTRWSHFRPTPPPPSYVPRSRTAPAP